MHDNPESEIKFENNREVVQWIESNLKNKMSVSVAYSQPGHKTEQLNYLEKSDKTIKIIPLVFLC